MGEKSALCAHWLTGGTRLLVGGRGTTRDASVVLGT